MKVGDSTPPGASGENKTTLRHGPKRQRSCHFVLPALLQKLVGEFFDFSPQNLTGIFERFFRNHKIKAKNDHGKLRSIFRKKLRSSKKIIRAKIGSADVHLNILAVKIWPSLRGRVESRNMGNCCSFPAEHATVCNRYEVTRHLRRGTPTR